MQIVVSEDTGQQRVTLVSELTDHSHADAIEDRF
jgi:hypothetical protein